MNHKFTLILFVLFANLLFANSYEQSKSTVTKTNTTLQKSQQKINTLDDETTKLYDEYRVIQNEIKNYKIYNGQLRDIVNSQNQELSILENSIQGLEKTSKEIMPFMAKMINTLEEFIISDYPFLADERKSRIEALKNNMKRADISIAAKYRQILEAYQIEMDYGNTIETYPGTLNEKKVTYLKIGRIGFYYQSFDKNSFYAWHQNSKGWVKLSDDYAPPLKKAIKIAKKQKSPELFFAAIAPAKDK